MTQSLPARVTDGQTDIRNIHTDGLNDTVFEKRRNKDSWLYWVDNLNKELISLITTTMVMVTTMTMMV